VLFVAVLSQLKKAKKFGGKNLKNIPHPFENSCFL